MNIDLGWLGKVVLEPYKVVQTVVPDNFKITHSGHTQSGIRVHGVLDGRDFVLYPRIWQNAILIKVE